MRIFAYVFSWLLSGVMRFYQAIIALFLLGSSIIWLLLSILNQSVFVDIEQSFTATFVQSK